MPNLNHFSLMRSASQTNPIPPPGYFKQEVAKKRTRRTVKQQRGIVGASLDVIKERRAQRPEARAAARQAAIKEGKEKKSASESRKKLEKAKSAAGAARGQGLKVQSKLGARGAPSKVNAKSR
jgi:large subunit ribosomal protein L24e